MTIDVASDTADGTAFFYGKLALGHATEKENSLLRAVTDVITGTLVFELSQKATNRPCG